MKSYFSKFLASFKSTLQSMRQVSQFLGISLKKCKLLLGAYEGCQIFDYYGAIGTIRHNALCKRE